MKDSLTAGAVQGRAYIIQDLSRLMMTYTANRAGLNEIASVFEVIRDNAEFILRFLDIIEFLPEIMALEETEGRHL
jgi:hypothetical protein